MAGVILSRRSGGAARRRTRDALAMIVFTRSCRRDAGGAAGEDAGAPLTQKKCGGPEAAALKRLLRYRDYGVVDVPVPSDEPLKFAVPVYDAVTV